MAAAEQNWPVALDHSREVVTQFGRSVDRMANWPADVKTFGTSAKPGMGKLKEGGGAGGRGCGGGGGWGLVFGGFVRMWEAVVGKWGEEGGGPALGARPPCRLGK